MPKPIEPAEPDTQAEAVPRTFSGAAPASRQSAVRSYAGRAPTTYTTGDVLLFRGTGFSSAMIRWATASTYSHAGLVYVWNGPAPKDGRLGDEQDVARVYVVEARGKEGVRLAPLSLLVEGKHYTKIDHYDVTQIEPEQREAAIRFAFPQLGKTYDHGAIWRFALYLLPVVIARLAQTRRWVPPFARKKSAAKLASRRENDQFFCSELVAAAFRYAKLHVDWETELISPENLKELRPNAQSTPYLVWNHSIVG